MNTCGIETMDTSDHAPTYLSVDFNLQPKNTTWELNSSLMIYILRNRLKKKLVFNQTLMTMDKFHPQSYMILKRLSWEGKL